MSVCQFERLSPCHGRDLELGQGQFLLFFGLEWKDTRSSTITGTFFCHTSVTRHGPCSLVDIKENFLQASNIVQVKFFDILIGSRVRNEIRGFECFLWTNGDRRILKVGLL